MEPLAMIKWKFYKLAEKSHFTKIHFPTTPLVELQREKEMNQVHTNVGFVLWHMMNEMNGPMNENEWRSRARNKKCPPDDVPRDADEYDAM